MEQRRFDDLTRTWARLEPTPTSRRRVLRGVLSLLGLGAAASVADTSAAGSGTCRAAPPSAYVSKRSCEVLACGTTDGCICVQTLGHVPVCVTGFDPSNRNDCPREDECNKRRSCRNGFVCAKVGNCCGRPFRRCLRRCPA